MPISGIEFHRPSTNEWVSAENRDPNDEDGLRLLGAGRSGVIEILYADIPGGSWNPPSAEPELGRNLHRKSYNLLKTDLR